MYESSEGKINAEFVKRNPKTNLWEDQINPENIIRILFKELLILLYQLFILIKNLTQ